MAGGASGQAGTGPGNGMDGMVRNERGGHGSDNDALRAPRSDFASRAKSLLGMKELSHVGRISLGSGPGAAEMAGWAFTEKLREPSLVFDLLM